MESLTPEQLRAALQSFERRFLMASGCVDLLAMSKGLPPEEFRQYILLTREARSRRSVRK